MLFWLSATIAMFLILALYTNYVYMQFPRYVLLDSTVYTEDVIEKSHVRHTTYDYPLHTCVYIVYKGDSEWRFCTYWLCNEWLEQYKKDPASVALRLAAVSKYGRPTAWGMNDFTLQFLFDKVDTVLAARSVDSKRD